MSTAHASRATGRNLRDDLVLMTMGLVLALAFALGALAVARAGGQDLVVRGRTGDMPLPVGALIGATVLGAVTAWVLLRWALRRPQPRTAFASAVAVGLVLSSIPPATAATGATTAWLLLLHAVVAVPLVGAAWRCLTLAMPS